jgi:hypothetical protein
MVDAGLYEDALNVCALCRQPDVQLKDLDVSRIHEKLGNLLYPLMKCPFYIRAHAAFSLFQKGDFEESIASYVLAKTNPSQVIMLFPDFVPNALLGSKQSAAKKGKLTGTVLNRAASAIVKFCEYHRPHVSS